MGYKELYDRHGRDRQRVGNMASRMVCKRYMKDTDGSMVKTVHGPHGATWGLIQPLTDP